MSAVVEAVSDFAGDVVDTVGDVVDTVVDTAKDVVKVIGDTAEKVVKSAIDDPIGTIAKIGTAIYAPYLLPAVSAADVVAHGGSVEDALTAAAVAYVTPEIGSAVSNEIAGTALGESLNAAADATGIESLPKAVTNGIGRAAASTVAGVARGQDFEDALKSGAISGIASITGNIAASEADTGYGLADKMIGTAVSAATNASLRDKDVGSAIENAVAMGLLNTGFGAAKNEIKSSVDEWMKSSGTVAPRLEDIVKESIDESTGVRPLMLASATSDTATDAPAGYYVDFDGSLKPITKINIEGVGAESDDQISQKEHSDAMYNALVDTFTAKEQPKTDELGNVIDETTKSVFVPSPATGAAPTDTGVATEQFVGGEQAGDYPMQIINNPDGSVTTMEANGGSYTFKADGSVAYTDPEGNTSVVGGPSETPETPSETTPIGSPSPLDNLVQTLLGPTTVSSPSVGFSSAPTRPSTGGSFVPAVLGGAALGAALAGDQGSYDQFGLGQFGFGWNPYDINPTANGVAYGQQFFEPTYTKAAAGGGLMSLSQPNQYIQPTVPNEMKSDVTTFREDPTSAVQMYAMGGHLGSYSDGGRMLKGPGDGMSDDIPATIAGRQPARLANEEFVIPADVVSHLGNGSSEAGAKVLYKMMADVRKARTGKTSQGKQINPERFMPRR